MKFIAVKFFAIILFALSMVWLASCRKENTSIDYNVYIETVGDYVEAQQMTDLLMKTYFKSITDSLLLTDSTAKIDGADVTLTSNPLLLKIVYPWCIPDGYGHKRMGSIEISSETGFYDSLSVIQFKFSGFYYDTDSVDVQGFSLTNLGKRGDNSDAYNLNINNFYRQTVDTSGNITFLKFELQQELKRFRTTPSPYYNLNDYFTALGNVVGVAQNAKSFTSVIADSALLTYSLSCNYITNGSVVMDMPDLTNNTAVNFNGGNCENIYQISIAGTLFNKAFDGESIPCSK